ncbi:MAG: hypothetical protein KC591_13760 [Gemmatimonadetes bacterium]|nr:hypothetical protein [Gemmatimonadota bacterium]
MNLAMSLALAGFVVGFWGLVQGFAGPGDVPAPTRGPEPLHRGEALAGDLALERPAPPVPARIAGDLEIRLPR